MKQTTVLLIMDGFGYNPDSFGNAIAAADTSSLDRISAAYPHTLLGASGLDVGLPDGQMGNSEVGHMNIGAGRIIYQDLTRISRAIEDGSFFENEALLHAMDRAAASRKSVHILGLLSDGGVHSHIDHLKALVNMASDRGVTRLYIHAFLDGRDVPPRCAETYIKEMNQHFREVRLGRIATISGRYYAMDRDKRWERVQKAYDALVHGKGHVAATPETALDAAYARGENDEFVEPTVIWNFMGNADRISSGDSVILFNFRPDRAREITRVICDDTFDGFDRGRRPSDLCFVCMTEYEAGMPNVSVAYPPEHFENTLGSYLSRLGKRQARIAETEKYAHVTFFFNGGEETPDPGEDRMLIPSPKVATYDLQPEMSADGVRKAVLDALQSQTYDLIVVNFANPDMVGHTGIFDAAVKAVSFVDLCAGEICDAVLQQNGNLFVTADHGNADTMIDADGEPITKHSTNPVPAIVVTPSGDDRKPLVQKLRSDGVLADIAPTILDLMGLEKPEEMTGTTLILRS